MKNCGIGTICIKTNTGYDLRQEDVRYTPTTSFNLISIHQLDELGCANLFVNRTWKLSKGNLVFGRGKKINTLYYTQAKVCTEVANAFEDLSTELWHRRLGHLSEMKLETLSKKKILPLKSMPLKTYTDCLSSKQHRVSFQRSPSPTRKPGILDLVHTDVCSMTNNYLSGCIYYVSFIDDHFRKVFTFPIKSKDQILDMFKMLHASVEREMGRKLKCVRADNGNEYRGPFQKY